MLALTPTPLRNLSQHRFEPVLLETLRALPAAELVLRSTSGSRRSRTTTASPRASSRPTGALRGPQPLAARGRRCRQPGAQVARHRADRAEPHAELHHDPLRGQPAAAGRRPPGRPLLDHRSRRDRRLRRPRHRLDLGVHARLGSRRRAGRGLRRDALRRARAPRHGHRRACRSRSAPSARGR